MQAKDMGNERGYEANCFSVLNCIIVLGAGIDKAITCN